MSRSRVAAPAQPEEPEEPKRKVWSPEVAKEAEERGESGMPRTWEEFMDGAEACFWGLTWDEGLMARRLAGFPTLNASLKREEKVDEELLQLQMIVLSARGGDTSEFAYDETKRLAPTLLKPGDPESIARLKKGIPAGRLQMLAAMVDRLSTVSVPKISESIVFFQAVNSCCSGLLSSVIPSMEAALSSSLTPDTQRALMADLDRIKGSLTDMNGLAETLERGYSTRGKSIQRAGSRRR